MTILLTLAALCMAIPLGAEWYARQLPIAPACPSCRWITKQLPAQPTFASFVPSLARTFLAECGRCGWHGRMRWTLARESGRRRNAF